MATILIFVGNLTLSVLDKETTNSNLRNSKIFFLHKFEEKRIAILKTFSGETNLIYYDVFISSALCARFAIIHWSTCPKPAE